ncbi:MAG: hypothetical protein UV74_C0002G0058 [Candidatus Woesebacteria bacterium GW2011_GWB1_43_14]|uniref:Uncharacterized protein n=1 Tax=Candidatus Woesebacteria bacterium GW2011_GWB1_43_14 TaxID=1618578 RepID=A0A0G1DMP4_9BACT|nr:MAG: hypothetical protein UV51_C0004G0007 [Candidatus Woesebacteria bacterium GW2011_GWC1_42_9]KKS98837.1 MAG: hypothetical protein UV74_C0002G0058 [Candidatus Woesebacteria bacterium GW2011_GWB1_43_14]
MLPLRVVLFDAEGCSGECACEVLDRLGDSVDAIWVVSADKKGRIIWGLLCRNERIAEVISLVTKATRVVPKDCAYPLLRTAEKDFQALSAEFIEYGIEVKEKEFAFA